VNTIAILKKKSRAWYLMSKATHMGIPPHPSKKNPICGISCKRDQLGYFLRYECTYLPMTPNCGPSLRSCPEIYKWAASSNRNWKFTGL
jgi:hypothetical protein